MNCFWCNCVTKQLTRDHVIPLWLGGNRVVPCCVACNGERSFISHLASFTVKRARDAKRKTKKKWRKHVEANVEMIRKYERLIRERLGRRERETCLKEIRLIVGYYGENIL